MIPRRDIIIYNGLLRYIFLYIKNCFFRKNCKDIFTISLQKYFLTNNIFLFNYGRTALATIFKIVDFKKGDEIIIPNYYLKELIPWLRKVGLKPIFCDINKKHLSSNLRDVISKITPKTKFVILFHTFGYCQDIDYFIKRVKSKKNDIIIIEDCAHAFGSEYKNKKLGTFGDFSFFSFNYIKPLNLLSGGLLVINSNKYQKKALTVYTKIKNASKIEIVKKIIRYYFISLFLKTHLFYIAKYFLKNKRTRSLIKKLYRTPSQKIKIKKLSNLQSMLGYYQLKKFNEKQNKIQYIINYYEKKIDKTIWQKRPLGYNSKLSNYFLVIMGQKNSSKLEDFMSKNNIDIGIKDELIDICKKDKDLKNSISAYNSLFQLPLYFTLKKEKIDKIANTLNKFFRNENY